MTLTKKEKRIAKKFQHYDKNRKFLHKKKKLKKDKPKNNLYVKGKSWSECMKEIEGEIEKGEDKKFLEELKEGLNKKYKNEKIKCRRSK